MAATYVYDGATFQEISEIHVYDGATFQQVQEAYVYDGGSWQLVFSAATVTLSGETVQVPLLGGTKTVGLYVNADGTVDKRENSVYTQIDASTDWIIPNAASTLKTYHVMLHENSGPTLNVGSAKDSWIDISTNPGWARASSVAGATNCTVSISDDGGSTTLTSNTYILELQT